MSRWLTPLLAAVVAAFLLRPQLFAPLLAPISGGGPAIYDRASLLALTASHLGIVLMAILPATLLAIGCAVLVTRRSGAEFLPLSRAIVGFGQSFPPLAVLALTVPVLGFGTWPTVVALFLYALLPIFENALAGLQNIRPNILEAADGAGMRPAQRIRLVELPLAAPLILEGVRIAAIVSLSTATIGSTVAAKGLGEVIIAGLNAQNSAFVVQGGLLTGALAVLISQVFSLLIRRLDVRTHRNE